MTDVDDLPFSYPDVTPANPAAVAKKCRRHDWMYGWSNESNPPRVICARCNAVRDEAKAKRGRTNRNRGNAIERQMAAKLGLRRVGQFGGPEDLAGDLFAAQVKSGLSFPERLWGWLKQVPTKAGQTPLLVVTDAPGPGRRRRALVILDLEDWTDLHGIADPLQLEETGQ